MLIGYLTTDEVNQALAMQIAGEYGAVIHVLYPKDAPPDGRFDAILYDLDDLPRPRRREFLAQLPCDRSDCLKAVHSYDLSDEQAAALRGNGVAVFQHLGPELFRTLHLEVDHRRTSVLADDARDGSTWIMLAE